MKSYSTLKYFTLNTLLLSLANFLNAAHANPNTSGAVYVMTNRVGDIGNSVLIFDRDTTDGTLRRIGLVDTGGLGGTVGLGGLAPSLGVPEFPGQTPDVVSGSPNEALASQDSLVISDTRQCLFAVNAGSNTVTSFAIRNEGRFLDLVGVYPSGGDFPLSITQRGNVAFVLNGAGQGTISGFRHNERLCTLTPLAHTTRSLNNVDFNPPSVFFSPAQVAITPNGRGIVAIVKGTHEIHYWSLSTLGFPSDNQVITASAGLLPFSFAFDANGNLVVGEAFGAEENIPTGNAGALSSYAINDDGSLTLISESVPNFQTATCWLRYSNGMLFTSNNAGRTPSVSIFSIDDSGDIVLLDGVAANGEEGGIDRPIDLTLSDDGSFLYVLNTGSTFVNGAVEPTISVFSVAGNRLESVEVLGMGLALGTTTPSFDHIQGVSGLAVF